MRSPILPLFLVGLAIAGCGRKEEVVEPDSLPASELKLLARQASSLRTAIADAKKGELFATSDLAVSVSEEAVHKAVSQAFPIERPVGTEFRARIDRALVSFRSMQGSVRLEGRVWALSDPTTYADLALLGGIHDVEVDESSGMLTAGIVLDGWDVERAAAAGAEMDWIKDLVRLLGVRGLAALRDLVPAVRIPVGIEKGIDLPGISGGVVTIPAGRLPLDARVSRVLPLSGRLWAMIHVTTPGWEPVNAALPPVSGPKRRSAPATGHPRLAPGPESSPEPPMTQETARQRVEALKAERLRLQDELRALLPDDARLRDAPRGDVLLGLPSSMVESIVSEALLGPLRNVRLSLKDVVKVDRADEVQTKTFLGMMTLGRYALTVTVQEVNAVMRPKTPKLSFGSNRIAIDLPVSVEAGEVKAKLLFKWDGRNLAGVVCGDLSREHDLRAAVPPVLVHLRGRFDLEARGEQLIVTPRIAPIQVAFRVEPRQGTWDLVDDLIESKNAVCEAALRKAEVGQKVKDLVSREFRVTLPTRWLHAMALPVSFRDTLDVQGTSAGIVITPTGVSITRTRIWYGANVALRKQQPQAGESPQHAGPRVKRNVAPDPGPEDSVQIRPPWASTMRLARESPTPVPSAFGSSFSKILKIRSA